MVYLWNVEQVVCVREKERGGGGVGGYEKILILLLCWISLDK